MSYPNSSAVLNPADEVLPNDRERKAWLHIYGAGMDL